MGRVSFCCNDQCEQANRTRPSIQSAELLPIRLNCIIYETTVLICQGANFVNANVLQCCCIKSPTARTSLNMSSVYLSVVMIPRCSGCDIEFFKN